MQLMPIELYIKQHKPNASFDAHQQNVIDKMILLQQITEGQPSQTPSDPIYKGLYLYGDVGRGKTMMVKTYFNSSSLQAKAHFNFHTFVQLIKEELNKRRHKKYPSLSYAINKVIPGIELLFLDEFYLTDTKTDKFIYNILDTIIKQKIILLITSNIAPDDLGLQKTTDLINSSMIVCVLQGDTDYRSNLNAHSKTTYYLLQKTPVQKIYTIFKNIIKHKQYRKDNTVSRGKKITAYRYCDGVAWFFFKQLCARNLNTIDYEAIANKYKTIFLVDIPILTEKHQNETKRFSELVDKLYEHRTKLICLAEAPAEELCQGETQQQLFKRTVSRLNAMQTKKYALSRHNFYQQKQLQSNEVRTNQDKPEQ